MVLIGTACGDNSGSSDVPGTRGGGMNTDMDMDMAATATVQADVTIDVTAPSIRFTPDRIKIPAGKNVKIPPVNLDPTEHDLQVDGLAIEVVGDTGMAGGHMTGSSDASDFTRPRVAPPRSSCSQNSRARSRSTARSPGTTRLAWSGR